MVLVVANGRYSSLSWNFLLSPLYFLSIQRRSKNMLFFSSAIWCCRESFTQSGYEACCWHLWGGGTNQSHSNVSYWFSFVIILNNSNTKLMMNIVNAVNAACFLTTSKLFIRLDFIVTLCYWPFMEVRLDNWEWNVSLRIDLILYQWPDNAFLSN